MNVDSHLIQGIRHITVCAVGFSMALVGFVLSVTHPVVTTLIPQLQAQVPPAYIEVQARRRAINSHADAEKQTNNRRIKENNSGTNSTESTSISSKGSTAELVTPSPPTSLSPGITLTSLPHPESHLDEVKPRTSPITVRHTCNQQCLHADAGPSTPSTRESSPLHDTIKLPKFGKGKKSKKADLEIKVGHHDDPFLSTEIQHDLAPIIEQEPTQARESRERRRHSGIFAALSRKPRSKSATKPVLGRSSSVPVPCSPAPTHASLPQDSESCSNSISSEGARNNSKKSLLSFTRLKKKRFSKKASPESESETVEYSSDRDKISSSAVEHKEGESEPARGRRSLCLTHVHTSLREGKSKEPPRRTQPYEAPYYFPTPYSPEVEGYVARTRQAYRRSSSPHYSAPPPLTALNPVASTDGARKSVELSPDEPHSAPSHRVEFVVPDRRNNHVKSASIGSVSEFGVRKSPLRTDSSYSRSPKRALTLPSPTSPTHKN